MTDLEQEMKRAVNESVQHGRAFALQIIQYAYENRIPASAVAYALAHTFASLLVGIENELTLYEHAGLGKPNDDDRILIHIDQIRQSAAEMRANEAKYVNN